MSEEKAILVCVDLSAASEAVIDCGAALAEALEARLHLLHVAAPEPDFVGYDEAGIYDRDRRAQELGDEHTRMQELSRRLSERGVPARALLVQGFTTETILAQADNLDAELIVVGSHDGGVLHRLLTGSSTDALVRRSTRPVVVVPISRGG